MIDELIEDIVVSEDGNIKVIFKYEDKYFEALDFINKQKYDIILYYGIVKVGGRCVFWE